MRQFNRFFGILLALVAIVGGVMLQKVSAQGMSLNELLFPPAPTYTPKTMTELSNTPIGQVNTMNRENTSYSPAATSKSANDQDIMRMVSDLITKADQQYLKLGWLHITSIKERFPPVAKFLPNGDPIPTRSVNDAWYQLGQNGFVIKAVILDNTGDALTTQEVIFEDGLWKNLTIPETNPTTKESYQIETLDQGLLGFSSSHLQTFQVEEPEGIEGGGTLIGVTETEIFDTPEIFDQSVLVKGMMSKYTLSKDSGRILIVENYQISPDGSHVLWDRITTTVVENLDVAPDEILNYFAG
ncbi:MAG: hypothetical protein PHQ40_11075 [Anaerolineaceae bacterium]|nr:hypothetical protein [Anaerolineaceae bacterium]